MIFNPFSIINSLIHGLTMYQIYVQHFVIIIVTLRALHYREHYETGIFSLLQLIITKNDCALLFILKLYKLFKNTLTDVK